MVARLGERWRTIGLARDALDVTNIAAVRQRVAEIEPRAIVNCAAYNDVDQAEEQPETAFEVNAFAVLGLARAAAECNATFIHFSSDFVFDGVTTRSYREDDRPNPGGVYAASKLVGEWFAASAPVHYVLRVESLFGGVGRRKSSLDRIIDAVAAGTPVKVFVDRIVSPSYVWDVASATDALLQMQPPAGLYHCVNSGAGSWQEVAMEVRRQLGANTLLEPVTMADVRLAAARPKYCALSNAKLKAAGIDMPTWQDALERCLRARGLIGRMLSNS